MPKVRFGGGLLDDLTVDADVDTAALNEDRAIRQADLALRLVGPQMAASRLANACE